MRVLNLRMMSHPMNYVVIVLMLLLAGLGGHWLLSLFGIHPGGGGNASNGQTTNVPPSEQISQY